MTTSPDLRYANDLALAQSSQAVQADLPAQEAPFLPRIDDEALKRAFKAAAQRDLDLAKQVWETQLPFKEKVIAGKSWKDTPARERFAFMVQHEPLYEPRIMGAIRDALFAQEQEQYQIETAPLMQAIEMGQADPATMPPGPVRDGYLADVEPQALMGLDPMLTQELMLDPAMAEMVPCEWLQKCMKINRREVAGRLQDYAETQKRNTGS